MTVAAPAPRLSGGFSLEEAARLARGVPTACPDCGGKVRHLRGADPVAPDRSVSLMRCVDCGKSLVLESAPRA